jgi:hypothetical protein
MFSPLSIRDIRVQLRGCNYEYLDPSSDYRNVLNAADKFVHIMHGENRSHRFVLQLLHKLSICQSIYGDLSPLPRPLDLSAVPLIAVLFYLQSILSFRLPSSSSLFETDLSKSDQTRGLSSAAKMPGYCDYLRTQHILRLKTPPAHGYHSYAIFTN